MAYDPRDRDRSRDPRSRYDEHRPGSRERGGERGFFERASDEVSSWFGDDEAERRRAMDERRWRNADDRGSRPPYRSEERSSSYRDEPRHRSYASRDDQPRRRDFDRDESAYRPLTGDYGRAAQDSFDAERPMARGADPRGSGATAAHDRHYSEWRQRQIDEIDRDYEDYRREHQSKFESDFAAWRSTRQQKRQLLGSIKEHMQVVGADDQPVGTVDRVRGDRIVLTKSDSPDARHHSVNCAMIDRVEGDRVILDKNAEEAKAMFGTEERDRALYERDDQREPGAHILNRSFSGTY